MTRYEDTDVFELTSLEEVDIFCDELRRMKEAAPLSLSLTVALTATRDVTFRSRTGRNGHQRGPSRELMTIAFRLSRSGVARAKQRA